MEKDRGPVYCLAVMAKVNKINDLIGVPFSYLLRQSLTRPAMPARPARPEASNEKAPGTGV